MTIQKAPQAPALYIGLAADTKPAPYANNAPNTAQTNLITNVGVPNGAILYTTDTPNWYIFDASTQAWTLIGATGSAMS